MSCFLSFPSLFFYDYVSLLLMIHGTTHQKLLQICTNSRDFPMTSLSSTFPSRTNPLSLQTTVLGLLFVAGYPCVLNQNLFSYLDK